MRIGSWFIAAALLAGCPKKKEPAEPVEVPVTAPDAGATTTQPGEIPEALRASVERALSLLDQLGAAAEAAAGDCDRMGASFTEIAEGPDGTAIKDIDADPAWQEHADAVAAEYGARLDEASARIGNGLAGCMENPQVNDALTKIGV